MKLTIAGLAAFAATKVYAGICSQDCGNFCADSGEESEPNFNQAGFEDVAECEAHLCSNTFSDDAAGWHECERGARELEGRKFNHIVKMSYQMIKRQGAGTNHSYRTLHKMIQNYGCHCFPGQSRSTIGHGPVVDAQDGLCRDLARCHRCVSMDWNAKVSGNDVIDVNFAKYRFRITPDGQDVSCERNTEKGKHQSVRDLCECDARFAREIAKIWRDDQFNDFFWLHPKTMRLSANGKLVPPPNKFNPASTCIGNENGKSENCCGSYPNRYPYGSDKACCQANTIYNSITQACCPGGEIATFGDC